MIPKELKFKSVQIPKEGNFYYIFFGNGLMVRAYYKGGDWKLPNTLMKELGIIMSEDEMLKMDLSKNQIFELSVEIDKS